MGLTLTTNMNITFPTSFVSILTLIFVVAKIWGKVTWSWWIVFSPLWISAIIATLICIVIIVGVIIAAYITK